MQSHALYTAAFCLRSQASGNQFFDKSPEELRALIIRDNTAPENETEFKPAGFDDVTARRSLLQDLKTSVDWRKEGKVTAVKVRSFGRVCARVVRSAHSSHMHGNTSAHMHGNTSAHGVPLLPLPRLPTHAFSLTQSLDAH